MTRSLKISLAQANACVGDFEANAAKITEFYQAAKLAQSHLLVLPEMFLTGYPCEDLVFLADFQIQNQAALEKLALMTQSGPAILVGALYKDKQDRLYNAIYLLQEGKIKDHREKVKLPNYGVFDEKRIFEQGKLQSPISFQDIRLGLAICEDIWGDEVTECLAESGAELIIAINGSPFEMDKWQHREQIVMQRVIESGLPLVYLNLVGGQDEMLFDGGSFAFEPAEAGENHPKLVWQAPWFQEELTHLLWQEDPISHQFHCTVLNQAESKAKAIAKPLERSEMLYQAMILGLKDYCKKNNFKGVIIGLSGGIDSALTAAVAVDALGKDFVHTLYMPSPYNSEDSKEDAYECARLLGVRIDEVPISHAMEAVATMLKAPLSEGVKGLAAENMQARLRGLALMTLSNQTGFMVLTTGNKSEIATGYSTLYGDMCGGFSVLKDLYKQDVFALSSWRNRQAKGAVMPERVISKPPSAELRPNQKDSDQLPEYEILDRLLFLRIEKNYSRQQLINEGFAPEIIDKILRLLSLSEYKRRQSAPGVKLSSKGFGRDWRFPITSHFKS